MVIITKSSGKCTELELLHSRPAECYNITVCGLLVIKYKPVANKAARLMFGRYSKVSDI